MMRLFIVLLAFFLTAQRVRSEERICPSELDHQLASRFVQRGLISSGFLDAEVGRAPREEVASALQRFRNEVVSAEPSAPLSEAECGILANNIDALSLAARLTPVAFRTTELKLLYPRALSPGREPDVEHKTSWFDLDTDDFSFGVDVFRLALYKDTPLSLQSGSLMKWKNVSLFYQQTASDEVTSEGIGDFTHAPSGLARRTVRYYFHNLAYEYNGDVIGTYLKYSIAPPPWFKPIAHLVPATRNVRNVAGIEHDFGKLSDAELAWIVFVRAVNNIVVSAFTAENGRVELTTGPSTGNVACATGLKSADPGRKNVRVIFGTTRNITAEFEAESAAAAGTRSVAFASSGAGAAPSPPQLVLSQLFGNDDQGRLHIGCAQMSVPSTRRTAKSLLPSKLWPLRKWHKAEPQLIAARRLDSFMGTQQKYVRVVDTAASKPIKRALLFVHGYNTSFDAALVRAAELAARTDYAGNVYMFSWPSRARAIDYFVDQDAAEGAQIALRSFMRAILQDRNVKVLDVVAHSMGALQVLRALENLQATFDRRSDNSAKAEERRLRLGQVVFAAPDVASKFFSDKVVSLAPFAERVTVYVSRGDIILWISRLVRMGRPRAGTYAWGKKPIEIVSPARNAKIHVIDVTGTRSGWRRFIPDSSFGHSDFVNNPEVNRDVGLVLEARYGEKRAPTDEARSRNRHDIFCKSHYAEDDGTIYWRMRAPPAAGERLPACDP